MDSSRRTLLKTISYRVLSALITLAVALFVTSFTATGIGYTALLIAGVDTTVKFFTYFMHERLWEKLPYGRPALAMDTRAIMRTMHSAGLSFRDIVSASRPASD